MKTIARPKDLTIGNPLTVLLAYSLPMFASMFFQQAYNLVDSWIAGNWVGAISLGAVGTCYPITVFCIAIASGLSMGTSIYCSQHFGAGASGEVRMGITTSLMVFLPFSVLLMIVGLFS
ncbi:MAG: MATE family efflux transporter, partial [Clostridium sp.]|nr:MATE family efflux transporter [Clostridium sp.]